MLSRESASQSHTAENRATSIAVRKVQGVPPRRTLGTKGPKGLESLQGLVLFLLFRKLDIQGNIR